MRGHQSKRSVSKTDVPVWLRACRHGRRVVGAISPDWVDRHSRGNEHDNAEDQEEEAASFGRVDRQYGITHNIVFCATWTGVLRVLVNDDKHQVQANEGDDDQRYEQNVQGIETPDDVASRKLAAKEQERYPRSHHGEANDHAVNNAQAVAREQVIRQRIASETLGHGQHEQDKADGPVELAWFAERSREEHAQHVQPDGRNK
ncbi:unannotated protein [freshwater metagenome]|uniref:Unannotated protein n=1 Tax=freshwater metagenome TaxID=449393 RepID=A0A6J7GB80_9ZZZZ